MSANVVKAEDGSVESSSIDMIELGLKKEDVETNDLKQIKAEGFSQTLNKKKVSYPNPTTRDILIFIPPLICCFALLISYIGFTSCHFINTRVSILKSNPGDEQDQILQNMGVFCKYGILDDIISHSPQTKDLWGLVRLLTSGTIFFGFISSIFSFFLVIYPDRAKSLSTRIKCLPITLAVLLQVLTNIIFSSPPCTKALSQGMDESLFDDVIAIETNGCAPGFGLYLVWVGQLIYIAVGFCIYRNNQPIRLQNMFVQLKGDEEKSKTDHDHKTLPDSKNTKDDVKSTPLEQENSTNEMTPKSNLIDFVINVDQKDSYDDSHDMVSTWGDDEEGNKMSSKQKTEYFDHVNLDSANVYDHTLPAARNLRKKPNAATSKIFEIQRIDFYDHTSKCIEDEIPKSLGSNDSKSDELSQDLSSGDESKLLLLPLAEENTFGRMSPPLSPYNEYVSDMTTSTLSPLNQSKLKNDLKKSDKPEITIPIIVSGQSNELDKSTNENLPTQSCNGESEKSFSNIAHSESSKITLLQNESFISEALIESDLSGDDNILHEEEKSDSSTRRRRAMWINQLHTSFKKNENEKLKQMLDAEESDDDIDSSSFFRSIRDTSDRFSNDNDNQHGNVTPPTLRRTSSTEDDGSLKNSSNSTSPSCVIHAMQDDGLFQVKKNRMTTPVIVEPTFAAQGELSDSHFGDSEKNKLNIQNQELTKKECEPQITNRKPENNRTNAIDLLDVSSSSSTYSVHLSVSASEHSKVVPQINSYDYDGDLDDDSCSRRKFVTKSARSVASFPIEQIDV